jgi:tripartite-type tricarboxylate transporter receptor subunit TctC
MICNRRWSCGADGLLVVGALFGLVLACELALLGGAGPVFAQPSYPNKPIRLLVGTAAGGPGDIAGRIAAASMSEALGQQIVIENRTGASGNLATQHVARAEPDGYTLLLANNSTAVNESMFKNFEFTAEKYFIPVAGFDETGLVLVVHPSLEVRSVADLIALAKSKPGEILYASAGKGTGTHLAAELFNMMTGVKMNPVHYRGGGETIKDLLSGEVKIMFSSIPPVLGLVKDGRLRGIATSQTKREPSLPDLPTIAESGVPGFDVRIWHGLFAPKGTPPEVIEKLSAAATKAVESETMRKALAAQGYEPIYGTRAQFVEYYKVEVARWAKLIPIIGTIGD